MGRKTEKTAGRSGAISCSRAREHFYGFAGCALNSEDRHNLSHHEDSCPVCGPEFKEWRRLRSVLQSNGENAVADFKAGVMGRIRETRQEPATRRSVVWGVLRQHGWARGLAAAAVILIMLSGAAKLPAGESLIAHLTRQVYIAFNRVPPVLAAPYIQPGQIHL
jgi:anti-sigma factor RsiW